MPRFGELRRTTAPEILDELERRLLEQGANQAISLGESAVYALDIWDRLTRFVDGAHIPRDNHATERSIRGPGVGRENHDGSRSRSGPLVAAYLHAAPIAADPDAMHHRAGRRQRRF